MKFVSLVLIVFSVVLAGCAGPVPYRSGNLDPVDSCAAVYAAYDARGPMDPPFHGEEATHPCWQRSIEEHAAYDLLIAEFTDQGWIQGSSSLDRPAPDYLDVFLKKLDQLYHHWADQGQGLSLFVYVHGWHHNAHAADKDVIEFRKFLADMEKVEATMARESGTPRRVLGILVGWRGESLDLPLLNTLTFWERKNTAERVALGTVRELLERLDYFRDRSRNKKNERDVRMLTIGHSFGGLVAYAAMGPVFLRNAVRFKEHRPGSQFDKFLSRIGDLVVIVNPAFEGARYEPLHTVGQRLCGVEPNQLPVLVMATSRADKATGTAFPAARTISTLLERTTGHEDDAIVKAVGHNERYITHELSLCGRDAESCRSACPALASGAQARVGELGTSTIESEYRFMQRFAADGFSGHDVLCGGLDLRATKQWHPHSNPFWVVRTTQDIIGDHGDIFNANFVAFFRQLYLGFIYARYHTKGDGAEANPCTRPG